MSKVCNDCWKTVESLLKEKDLEIEKYKKVVEAVDEIAKASGCMGCNDASKITQALTELKE